MFVNKAEMGRDFPGHKGSGEGQGPGKLCEAAMDKASPHCRSHHPERVELSACVLVALIFNKQNTPYSLLLMSMLLGRGVV